MKSNIGNTVIETESFIKQADALWSAAELDDLKDYVARNPLAGRRNARHGRLAKAAVGPGRHWEARRRASDLLLL
jgi:hypothetical protein